MSVETNVSREDLELIAAVLDGRLAGEARSAALERIEADEAMREVFAESARFLAEEKEEAEESRPPAARQAPARFWKVALPIAAAATLAALLLGRPGDWTARPASGYLEDLETVKKLEDDWQGSGDRGDGEQGNSFRLGVDLMQLHFALRQEQVEPARLLARALQSSLREDFLFLELPAEMAGEIQKGLELETRRPVKELLGVAERLDRELSRNADDLLDIRYYALGKWAEAGRLAAFLGQRNLLDDSAFQAVAQKAAGQPDLDPDLRKLLGDLDRKLRQPPDEKYLSGLETGFNGLIRAASG